MFGQFLSYPFVICVYVGSSERQAISFSQLDNLYVLLNQLQVKGLLNTIIHLGHLQKSSIYTAYIIVSSLPKAHVEFSTICSL